MQKYKITNATCDREIISLWLNDKSKTTISSYQCHVKQFLEFVGKPLAEIVLEDLTLWVKRLELTYQPVTVANKILTVKSLLSFTHKVGYLPVNLGSFIKSPKLKDRLAERILEESDIKKLIGAARTNRDRCILTTLYGLGLRVSELCSMTWADLKPFGDGGRANIFGKGRKTRLIVVPPALWNMLMALSRSGKAVFVSRTGRPLERTRIHRLIKECAERGGVNEDVSSHWLRHCHGSHAVRRGCNLRVLQRSMGHSKLETTERYLHVNEDEGSGLFLDL